MRAKTILAILFLFSVALAGVLAIRAMPHDVDAAVASTPKEKEIVKDEVLVAATSVAAGTLLRAQDVRWTVREGEAHSGEIVRPSGETRAAKPETDDAARAAVYG